MMTETTHQPDPGVKLVTYRQGEYHPGRGAIVRGLWYLISLALFESGWFPFSKLKVAILRIFGAKLGQRVVIKPHVRIKFPWRLIAGDDVWIGQEVWIDNLAKVTIGGNSCLSQGVYLCTGSHDHRKSSFDLLTSPIRIDDECWICARAILLPGVTIGIGSLVAAGSVVTGDVSAETIVGGNPAKELGKRTFDAAEEG